MNEWEILEQSYDSRKRGSKVSEQREWSEGWGWLRGWSGGWSGPRRPLMRSWVVRALGMERSRWIERRLEESHHQPGDRCLQRTPTGEGSSSSPKSKEPAHQPGGRAGAQRARCEFQALSPRKLLGSSVSSVFWKEDSDVPYCGYFSIYGVEHLMIPFNLETQVY